MESNITGSNSFSWIDVDWSVLRRLRARFLQFDSVGPATEETATEPDRSDYWHSAIELVNYDFTFGERIGWKWDTVIAELKTRGWTPPAGTVVDWGCGTGSAGRRVVEAWPAEARKLILWDRSDAARRFASVRARMSFPGLDAGSTNPGVAADLVVISHVLNELSPESLERLLSVVRRAQAVLWVEPGTAAVSRKLIAVRERMLGEFHPVAPCTHEAACGMLTAGNERHWCHHFAKIPGFVHSDSGWSRFSSIMEIDLSTLPMSFLVLDRRTRVEQPQPELSRVIGRPRNYTGFARALSCQSDGVRELMIQTRDSPALVKEMKKDPGSLYLWERDGGKVRSGSRVF